MDTYYVNHNAQRNGDHEVHKDGCRYMPSSKLRLGSFSNCRDAVREEKKRTRSLTVATHAAMSVI